MIEYTRTETLRLLEWELLDKSNANYMTIFNSKNELYCYKLEVPISKTNILIDRTWFNMNNPENIFNKPYNKENYMEAIELCGKLFKGENID